MNRILLLALFLLGGCTFEKGGTAALKVVISNYPAEVAQGESFEILIDVLNIDEALELNVNAPEGITVAETIGASFAVLAVSVGEAEPNVQTILVDLAAGQRKTTVNLGFTVTEESDEG